MNTYSATHSLYHFWKKAYDGLCSKVQKRKPKTHTWHLTQPDGIQHNFSQGFAPHEDVKQFILPMSDSFSFDYVSCKRPNGTEATLAAWPERSLLAWEENAWSLLLEILQHVLTWTVSMNMVSLCNSQGHFATFRWGGFCFARFWLVVEKTCYACTETEYLWRFGRVAHAIKCFLGHVHDSESGSYSACSWYLMMSLDVHPLMRPTSLAKDDEEFHRFLKTLTRQVDCLPVCKKAPLQLSFFGIVYSWPTRRNSLDTKLRLQVLRSVAWILYLEAGCGCEGENHVEEV